MYKYPESLNNYNVVFHDFSILANFHAAIFNFDEIEKNYIFKTILRKCKDNFSANTKISF